VTHLLNTSFLAVAQNHDLHAGAVLILFLFVIMVLNPRIDAEVAGGAGRKRWQRLFSAALPVF